MSKKLVKLYSTENEENVVSLKDSIELLSKKCLSISLLIKQENVLMYLTCGSVQLCNSFINKNDFE